MASPWAEVIGLLCDQLEVQETLLEMAKKKAELVVEGRIRDLELLLLTEETLLVRAGRLESARQDLHGRLALTTGEDVSGLTLKELATRAPADARVELNSLEVDLRRVTSELGRQAQVNLELLKQALTMVNYQLSLLDPSGTGQYLRPHFDRKA
ncbi:MAG: flagellar export chaperone FlgN [Bacillota bacterium]